MSRKWERMVRKNSKQLNRMRQKSGLKPIEAVTKEQEDVFKGRSWFLPVLLVACSLFFAIMSGALDESGTLYWVTVLGYLALAVMYFLRRPYIRVGKRQLSTRRLGVERVYAADEIESIAVQRGSIVIQMKGKRTRWVLSKFQNLYDVPAIAARLRTFAQQNGIAFQEEAA
jgi:hypothetical protein